MPRSCLKVSLHVLFKIRLGWLQGLEVDGSDSEDFCVEYHVDYIQLAVITEQTRINTLP